MYSSARYIKEFFCFLLQEMKTQFFGIQKAIKQLAYFYGEKLFIILPELWNQLSANFSVMKQLDASSGKLHLCMRECQQIGNNLRTHTCIQG